MLLDYRSIIMSLFFSRIAVLGVTGVAILSLAAGCSIPNPFQNLTTQKTPVAVGILKHDPAVKAEGFGKVNRMVAGNGEEVSDGLTNSQIAKLIQVNGDKWIAFSWNSGLFQTENGGRLWKRQYLFSTKDKTGDEYNKAVSDSNGFSYSDVAFTNNNQDVYIGGQSGDKFGKIYKSIDAGSSFKEVFSDVNSSSRVRRIVVDANRPATVYAVQDNQMLYSRDSGNTWSRWVNLQGKVIQMGVFSDKRTYAFTDSSRLYIFTDRSGVAPEFSEISLKVKGGGLFGSGAERIEQSQKDAGDFLVISNNALWVSRGGYDKEFEQLALPTVGSSVNILTATLDPKLGADRIIVSVNNKLFESNNRGKSWKTASNLGLESEVGSIGVIAIDRDKTDVIYLGLVR